MFCGSANIALKSREQEQADGASSSLNGSSRFCVGDFGVILDLWEHTGQDLEAQVLFVS